LGPPGAVIGFAIGALVSFFEDLFGGSDSPPVFRKLRHDRHPLYTGILGVPDSLIPDEAPARPQDPCDDVPGDRSVLNRNIQLARRHPWPWYLALRLANGGKWDYRPTNDAFGNFNYGATMTAAGYPKWFIHRFAGGYHECCGAKSGDESGSPLGDPPYGNRPLSDAEIAKGIDYVEMGCDHR
jgi:hypothetical protein